MHSSALVLTMSFAFGRSVQRWDKASARCGRRRAGCGHDWRHGCREAAAEDRDEVLTPEGHGFPFRRALDLRAKKAFISGGGQSKKRCANLDGGRFRTSKRKLTF